MEHWDVIVVGAGPAGASAALAARRASPSSRVLLLDRCSFPRDKPCGDGVAPQAVDLLANLEVPDPTRGHQPVQRLQIDGPRGRGARRTMARPAWVIPRVVLDARIVAAAVAAGAVLRRQLVRHVAAERQGVVVDGILRARTLIGADGANGISRAAAGQRAQPPGHLAVAIRGYAPDPGGQALAGPEPATQVLRLDDGKRWPAYAWSFPLNDGTGRANVGYGALVEQGHKLTRRQLSHQLRQLIPGSAGATRVRGHRLPLSSWRPTQPDGPVLLAGDAAALINPFTGEGIWYAIRSGALAGHAAVCSDRPASAYRSALDRALGRHHRDVAVLSRLMRYPQMVDAGISAAAADQGAFDDLVEMGLADGGLSWRLARGTAQSWAQGRVRRL